MCELLHILDLQSVLIYDAIVNIVQKFSCFYLHLLNTRFIIRNNFYNPMAFDWFFKRGFRGHRGPDVLQSDDDVQGFVDIHKNEKNDDSFDIPFIETFGSFEDTSHDIFQRMDDLLSRMFSSSFASFGSEVFSDEVPNESDPRSVMLKEPCGENPVKALPFEGHEPALLIDSDIDDKVAKHGLILDVNPGNNSHKNFSYKKFSSFRTVQLPDGTFEEHRTVTDSKGNTTTTIRRSIGEQSHEITTHSDLSGLKEKQENFTNLDENDLPEFEKRWQKIKGTSEHVPALELQPKSPKVEMTPPTGDPLYLTLFKKFFNI